MIQSFKHKGLERFYIRGNTAEIQSAHRNKLRLILGRLNAATTPQDMDLPSLVLHPLQGRLRGRWSVRVSGNWRVTFKFEGQDAFEVNYEDYH
ncbi:MAG: type II toxin-antitoxin system RelE/ParE family toxin [Pseudomonadota bacterium]